MSCGASYFHDNSNTFATMGRTYPSAELEHIAYVEHWSENATRLDRQGVYHWMAEQLAPDPPTNVLDIGCGTGSGIAAMRKAFGCRVLGIDHNEACIDMAFEMLRRLKGRTTKRHRFDYAMQSTGQHVIGVDQSRMSQSSASVALVQGDLLLLDLDPPLRALVDLSAPYDAVTVWLIGAFEARSSCASLASLELENPAEYRFEVQNRAYTLASTVLRPGGVLHIVDRCAAGASGDAFLQVHRDQAEGTSMHVESLSFRNYREEGNKGVRLVSQADAEGEMTQLIGEAQLVSVIARKTR